MINVTLFVSSPNFGKTWPRQDHFLNIPRAHQNNEIDADQIKEDQVESDTPSSIEASQIKDRLKPMVL